jgi:hypothetical protein
MDLSLEMLDGELIKGDLDGDLFAWTASGDLIGYAFDGRFALGCGLNRLATLDLFSFALPLEASRSSFNRLTIPAGISGMGSMGTSTFSALHRVSAEGVGRRRIPP